MRRLKPPSLRPWCRGRHRSLVRRRVSLAACSHAWTRASNELSRTQPTRARKCHPLTSALMCAAIKFLPKSNLSIRQSLLQVQDFELVGSSGRGLPTVKVLAFDDAEPLPLFLEGPTRHLKTMKHADVSARRDVYNAVAASTLHDTELSMYKISESLKGQPFEIGRMMAFDSGWLENESIWLHMSYKFYLEVQS